MPPPNPPQLPVRDFPTPEVKDGIVVELIDNNKGAYTPIPIGSRLEEGTDSRYAGYELVDVKTSQDYRWTYRYWANAATNQDVYNAEVSYDGESLSYPIYRRTYVERRPYTPRTRGLPLTAVIGVTVTAGGSGYTVPPTVTIAGTGAGATAEALIYRGAVVFVRVLTEGTGYDSASLPTVSFAGGGGGGGATAVAQVQPKTALLVKEEEVELGDGDPRSGLYDRINRVWATLPGWTATETKINPETRQEVTVSKTRKLTSAITPGVSILTVGPDTWVRVVSLEPIDELTSYEVITLQKLPAAHSFATAIQETDYSPFQFPATLDVDTYVLTSGVIGYTEPFTRRVKHQKFTWWEISLTEPDITTLMEDLTADGGIPILGYVFAAFRNGGSVQWNTMSEIIYNPVTLDYGGGVMISWPGSDPDFDTYLADWVTVGADPRNVIGRVSAGDYYMWKLEIVQVNFLIEPRGTIVP